MTVTAHWKAEGFLICKNRPVAVHGWTYRGIGLHGRWSLTHLNSGLRIRLLSRKLTRAEVLVLATELAELGDWDFMGESGWKNRCPDLPDKLQAWHQRHGLAAIPIKRKAEGAVRETVARQIAATRA